MAKELQYTITGEYQKGNSLKQTFGGIKNQVTVSGNVALAGVNSVGTSEEAIPLGEVTAAKAGMYVKNLDDTNYVEIRDATGASNDVIYVPAGKDVFFYFGTDVTAPYWIANTAAVLVEWRMYPN